MSVEVAEFFMELQGRWAEPNSTSFLALGLGAEALVFFFFADT